MRNLICKNCGKDFQAGKGNFKFCLECRVTAQKRRSFRAKRNPKHYNPCPICSKPKYKTSELCIQCRTATWKGDKHPGWKGGRFTEPRSGYVFIRIKGDYMPEHRYVWEQTYNRKLPPNWIVHHLNGVRSDNRLVNLIAMPRKHHPQRTLVPLLQQRIRELEQLHLFPSDT